MPTRPLGVAWLLLVGGLAVWVALTVTTRSVIVSDLLALLPLAERDAVMQGSVARLRDRFERRVDVLIGAPDKATAVAAAQHAFVGLQATGRFEALQLRRGADTMKQIGAFYLQHRFSMLSDSARQQLAAGDEAGFEQAVLRRYFGLGSGTSSDLIERDPLLLLPDFLGERAAGNAGRLRLEDGYLTLTADGRSYILLSGELADSPFSIALQEQLMPVLQTVNAELPDRFDGTGMITAGVLLHAAAGTAAARTEISSVGLGSLAGIALLFLVVFRSPTPLCLCALSIAIGCLGGFATTLALFGQVHLLTLVFGASLIGISVDYSFHYFCDNFRLGEDWTPREGLAHILPGITLGLVTSIIGFAGLLIAPFPGMREMAVFSSAGLIFAFFSVVLLYPLLSRRSIRGLRHSRLLDWAAAYRRLWERKWGLWGWTLLAVFLAISVVGGLRLTTEDDIRLLQPLDPSVAEQERRLRDLIGEGLASQLFIVEAADEAELLERQELLIAKLSDLEASDALASHLAFADWLPSPTRQAENRALVQTVIEGDASVLRRIAEQVGLPDATVEAYVEAFAKSADDEPASLSAWLESPIAQPYRDLWLGQVGDRVVAAVGLRGVRDLAALEALAEPEQGIVFYDGVGELSELFGHYRRQTAWLTAGSYVVVALLLVLRYGLRGGAAVMLAPLGAAVASLAGIGLIGETVSLFNIMAILLVLGIGIDYSIFFRETGTSGASTLAAIALSCVTTLLAFGLLSLSATTAVHAFGVTILIGISVAFLLSPTAAWGRSNMKPGLGA